jgi:prevent-host-death family protein
MWQVADAKNKFSELLSRAATEGPQRVRRRGETFVVLSEAEFQRLGGTTGQPKMTLAEFLMSGPSFEGLDLERRKSPMRRVDLE